MQDELADEVDGGLAHHGGRVFERILHCILAIWLKQNFGVLGDDHGHAFEGFSPASSNKKKGGLNQTEICSIIIGQFNINPGLDITEDPL